MLMYSQSVNYTGCLELLEYRVYTYLNLGKRVWNSCFELDSLYTPAAASSTLRLFLFSFFFLFLT